MVVFSPPNNNNIVFLYCFFFSRRSGIWYWLLGWFHFSSCLFCAALQIILRFILIERRKWNNARLTFLWKVIPPPSLSFAVCILSNALIWIWFRSLYILYNNKKRVWFLIRDARMICFHFILFFCSLLQFICISFDAFFPSPWKERYRRNARKNLFFFMHFVLGVSLSSQCIVDMPSSRNKCNGREASVNARFPPPF